jgi:mannosyltransferase
VLSSTAESPLDSIAPPRPRRRLHAAEWVLGLIAFALSAAGSWIPSLWGDEVTSVLSAQRPLPSLFMMLGHVDAVHGTYYLLLHFWIDVFGASPFSVRLPSAIAAGLATAGVVALARRLSGGAGFDTAAGGPPGQRQITTTAVIAGVVCIILPRVTYMGEEARSYALSAACATWLTVLLVHIIQKRALRTRLWILYGIGVAVCAYVFLFSLLLLVSHAVVILSLRRPGWAQQWMRWAGVGLLLALPVIAYGIAERGQVAFLASRQAASFGSVFYGQWFGNPVCAVLAWTLVAAAIVVPLIPRFRRTFPQTEPNVFLLAAVWAGAPVAILLSVNVVSAIYSSRYLSFCVPAVALLIGSLLGRIRPLWISVVAVIALAACAAPSYVFDRTPYAKNGSDWANDAAVIQKYAHPGQGVIFDETTRPSQRPRLAMGGYPAAFAGLKDIELKTPWYENTSWSDTTYPLDHVLGRLDNVKTVWVLELRPSGTSADTTDLDTLRALGFSPARTFTEHRTTIIELTR